MNFAKKIMFAILFSICLWDLGIFAFLSIQKFDVLLNIIWDKQSLLNEKKFIEENQIPMQMYLQQNNFSDEVKQFNIDENKHFVSLYEKISDKYQEEVVKRLNENYGTEITSNWEKVILCLVLLLVSVCCFGLLYWSVKWNWFFGISISFCLAFFPLVYLLISFRMLSVDRVLSQRMVDNTQACMAENYAEKSNCIETLNFLNELQVKRAFIKSKMQNLEYPFLYVTEDSEIKNVKFKSTKIQTTNFKPINTIIERKTKDNPENKSCFIPNLETWGGLYYIKLK